MVDRDQKWKLENQEEDLFIHNFSFDIKNNSKLLKKEKKYLNFRAKNRQHGHGQ